MSVPGYNLIIFLHRPSNNCRTLLKLLIVILWIPIHCFAGSRDTITNAEISGLIQGYRTSSFHYYNLLDSLSMQHDSVKLGYYIKKIDPYYLMWQWQQTERPDTLLAHYSLREKDKKDVLDGYLKVLRSNKSEAYHIFKRMADEDQEIRFYMEKSGDVYTSRRLSQQMRRSDSLNAAYLFDYVKNNGWPGFADGAMYATVLAIHDHKHHDFYMPYLKNAAKKGLFEINALMLINYFQTRSNSDKILNDALETGNYTEFDISEMLNDKLPSGIQRICNFFSSLCGKPFKYYYRFYAPANTQMTDWIDVHSGPDNIIKKFQEHLQLYCPSKVFAPEVWDIGYAPAQKTSFKFYIVYTDTGLPISSGKKN